MQAYPATQHAQQTPAQAHTAKNSPSTAKIARFGRFWARWAKNFAFATRALPAGRIFSRRPPLTSHAAHTPRYKTLPAQEKPPISAHSRRAGRTFSRCRRKQPEQGESFPADRHSPATQRTLPGTKLSPHSKLRPIQPIRGEQGELFPGADANNPSRENLFPQTTTHQPRSAHAPVQNSPGTRHARPQPVQNSPHTAKNAHFGPFSASREKNIPVQTQTTRAGRIFSRRPPLTSHAGHAHRYKTLRAIPASRPTGTKLSQHTACKATTGTKLSQHRKNRPFRPI